MLGKLFGHDLQWQCLIWPRNMDKLWYLSSVLIPPCLNVCLEMLWNPKPCKAFGRMLVLVLELYVKAAEGGGLV